VPEQQHVTRTKVRPGVGDLGKLADSPGRLDTAAYVQHLHPARLDQPFPIPG
jgi:hypothetical protein